MRRKFLFTVAIMAVAALLAPTAAAQLPAPDPTTLNFCDEICATLNNAAVLALLLNDINDPTQLQIALLLKSLDPDSADINGSSSVLVDSGGDLISFELNGNGIPDFNNELRLLEVIFADSGFDNGVITHADAQQAWADNWEQLVNQQIGVTAATLLDTVGAGSLLSVLTAVATLGDGDYSLTPQGGGEVLIEADGSFGFTGALMKFLEPVVAGLAPFTDADLIKTNPAWNFLDVLAKAGDGDGDGCCNFGEFNFFTPSSCSPGCSTPTLDTFIADACAAQGGCTKDAGDDDAGAKGDPGTLFVSAALDASETADSCLGCGVAPIISGASQVEVGSPLTLSIIATGALSPVVFQWSKDGNPISGADQPDLVFPSVDFSDAGTYTATVNDGSKALFTTPPFVLSVLAAVPVGGGALMVLVAALGAGSIAVISRRRRS